MLFSTVSRKAINDSTLSLLKVNNFVPETNVEKYRRTWGGGVNMMHQIQFLVDI
jgi:hypothetical protein